MFDKIVTWFTPYLWGFLAALAASAGLYMWYLNHKVTTLTASKTILEASVGALEGINEQFKKDAEKQNDQVKKLSKDHAQELELLRNDITIQSSYRREAQRNLDDANKVISKMVQDGDDDTRRFLGPLPRGILEFLRKGHNTNVPAPKDGSDNGGKAASGEPFAGYPGAVPGSD